MYMYGSLLGLRGIGMRQLSSKQFYIELFLMMASLA